MLRALALFGWVVGCGSDGETSDGTSPPTDEEGSPTGDTGTPPGTTPTATHTGAPTGDALGLACDPTGNALRFTCRVTVEPAAGVELRFSKADGSGATRTVRAEAPAAAHDLPLYFLAEDTAYTVEVATLDAPADVATATITTGTAPASVGAALTVSGAATTPYVGTNLPCDQGSAVAGVFDTATGELVWYQEMDASGSFSGMQMVQFTEDHTVLGQTGDAIVEVDLLGADLLRKPYSDDFHHDLFRRGGKTWILYSEVIGTLTLDGFVVWDASGDEIGRWREADALEVPRSATGDWTHTNSIWVDEHEDVLLSLHTQDTLVKVDADGATEWVLAGASGRGLGQDFVVDWSGVATAGFGAQHAASFRPDGRLQLLDNDHGRGLVLTVDEGSLTATVDEAFATGSATCGPQGTTTTTAAGGALVACSGVSLREFGPGASSPTWTATLACDNGASGGGGGGPGGGGAFGAVRWYALDGW